MDLKPLIPSGLIDRLVGLSGLQRAYFGVQNAGRNVTCPPQGPLRSETRTPGQMAARINGDVSKGRHHTVTVRPTREYAPPLRGLTQILQPSPLVARIRFAQDGCWAEFEADVKRGINVTVPATMIEVILHNEGPTSALSIEGVETVGRLIDAAVFIDEQPYFKRHSATRTIVDPTPLPVSGVNSGLGAINLLPPFAISFAGVLGPQGASAFSGVSLQFLNENNAVVGETPAPANLAGIPFPIPGGSVSYRYRNGNAGFGISAPIVTVWELAF